MSDASFEGFVRPTKNYFPMPNEWIDICAQIDNLAELKIIQYVLRHTWGFHEYGIKKTISVDEFMHGRRRQDRSRMDNGTGLSEPSVKDGIKRAIKHGYLVCDVDDKDQGRVKKSYALKMILPVEGGGNNLTGQESYPVGNLPPEDKKLTPPGQESSPRSEKNTLEKHSGKTLEERESNSKPPSENVQSHKPPTPTSDQQIKKVYDTFDTLFREALKDPDFFCLRTIKAEQDAIKGLLECKATSARLRDVFMDMWNQQDEDGKFFWRDHMSIKNVCSQYSQRIASIGSKKLPKEKPKQSSSPPSPPESSAIPVVPFKPRVLAATGR